MKRLLQRIWNSEPVGLARAEVYASLFGVGIMLLTVYEEHPVYDISIYRSLTAILLLYVGCIAMNFFVVPAFIRKESLFINALITVFAFVTPAWVVEDLDLALMSAFVFGGYTAVRYNGLYIWRKADAIQAKYRYISPGVIVATVLWSVSTFFLWIGDADLDVLVTWATLIPLGIALYSYSFYELIPKSLNGKRPFLRYVWKATKLLLLITPLLAFAGYLVTRSEDTPSIIGIVNFFLQLMVTVPLSWMLHKRFSQGREELRSLQQSLGQSVAGFDFLRSQINPHFLFNVLNSLYGVALQENAPRTSEAIQRLGDMMRFMLQENMQDKISLVREVEYLKNYIALQSLRVDSNPSIVINVDIQEGFVMGMVPPMLLIPFVENAFKHGISFREPSSIRISLAVHNQQLDFKVENTRHTKAESDPEKQNSGIGLPNVKQRLELFFPGTHALNIQETISMYFVHLIIPVSLRPE